MTHSEHKKLAWTILLTIILAFSSGSISFGLQSFSAISSTGTITYLPSITPDYEIYRIGNTYYARFMEINETLFSGQYASSVINSAINSLDLNKERTILLRPGEYLLLAPIKIASNLTLVGSGIDLTILKASSTTLIKNKDYTQIGNSNIRILNMTLDGDTTNGKGSGILLREVSNILIDNVKIINTFYDAIQINLENDPPPIKPSENIIIKNCIISNCGKVGGAYTSDTIAFHDVRNFIISNNNITDGGARLILVTTHPSSQFGSINGLILNNYLNKVAGNDALFIGRKSQNITIDSTFMGNAYDRGAFVNSYDTSFIHFKNCEFFSNGLQGLLIVDSSFSSIYRCKSSSNGWRNKAEGSGIDIVGCSNISIVETEAFNNSAHGFSIRSNSLYQTIDIKMEKCKAHHNEYHGCKINKDTNYIGNIIITKCFFNENKNYGIYLNYPKNCTITYNDLTNNGSGSLYLTGVGHTITGNIGYP